MNCTIQVVFHCASYSAVQLYMPHGVLHELLEYIAITILKAVAKSQDILCTTAGATNNVSALQLSMCTSKKPCYIIQLKALTILCRSESGLLDYKKSHIEEAVGQAQIMCGCVAFRIYS